MQRSHILSHKTDHHRCTIALLKSNQSRLFVVNIDCREKKRIYEKCGNFVPCPMFLLIWLYIWEIHNTTCGCIICVYNGHRHIYTRAVAHRIISHATAATSLNIPRRLKYQSVSDKVN